jgi:transcriptional regulator with XRE-family HTH domain
MKATLENTRIRAGKPFRKKILMSRRRKEIDTSTYRGRCAQRLLDLRLQSGFTATEVAERLEIPLRTYQQWENGRSTMDFEKVTKIASIFNIEIAELFPDKAKETPSIPKTTIDTNTYAGKFAIRLKGLRESEGISVSEIAKKLNLEVAEYLEFERGNKTPILEHTLKIAEILDVPLRVLTMENREK